MLFTLFLVVTEVQIYLGCVNRLYSHKVMRQVQEQVEFTSAEFVQATAGAPLCRLC